MIDEKKLAELRSMRDGGPVYVELFDTIEALWKENAEMKQSALLQKGHMLHVMFTDCAECVSFHAQIRKERAIVRVAEEHVGEAHANAGPAYFKLCEVLTALKEKP